MSPDEIYLAQFPFGDVPGMKLRPVLLLTGTIGSIPEVLVAYISSVVPTQFLPSDVLLIASLVCMSPQTLQANPLDHWSWRNPLPTGNLMQSIS